MKWTHKLFFALLGRCVLNAYIIFKENNPTIKVTTCYHFNILAVEGMMGNHRPPKSVRKRRSDTELNPTGAQIINPPAIDVQPVSSTCTLEKLPVGKKRDCPNNHSKRTRTAYQCPTCDKGLCPKCFMPHHRAHKLL
ncbi:PiggyBac transposable element-derived protein 4 [Plakobranchus ocellatus]|uniref:PiggyBac transposable element-derived protein 4 n=1 Tax=Plakobranchus ocellatus TaxID=259542 RepID=A0AAV4B2I3_9GAST|nr:PiggyBac transposable element-derived protein 4 [Plakobranchus ocellatus]